MYEVKVSGMTCSSCASAIKYALRTIDPDVEVDINLATQTVKVETDKEQSEVTALIEDSGFPVIGAKRI